MVKIGFSMAARMGVFICVFTMFYSCETNLSAGSDNASAKLVLNTALTNPYFPCLECKYATGIKLDEIKRRILKRQKYVYDDSLGIEMALHLVNFRGSGAYPHAIIYVTNKKKIEYAFSFDDEYYYLDQAFMIQDERVKRLLLRRHNLKNQLNTVTAILDIRSIEDGWKIDGFSHLLFDSLLDCHEIGSTSMINELRKSVKRDVEAEGVVDSCALKYNANLDHMRYEIQRNVARYVTPFEGMNGYWRIKIDTVGDHLVISPTLENYQCYTYIGL